MAIRFGLALALAAVASAGEHEVTERLESAATVLDEAMSDGKDSIPNDLLNKAHCVVIVPSLKRGAFLAGAQYGVGVATCRKPSGKGWSAPSTVRMEGGSFGLQAGGGETDVVLVVMNETGAQKLMGSEFTLGGEGAVMLGPLGKAASAETDAYMQAEVLSYSRSRGAFAGIAVKGSTLRSDDGDNRKLYGRDISHREILTGNVPVPAAAKPLISKLSKYSRVEE